MGDSNSDPPDCKPGTLSTRLFARIQCRDAILDACITFLKISTYMFYFLINKIDKAALRPNVHDSMTHNIYTSSLCLLGYGLWEGYKSKVRVNRIMINYMKMAVNPCQPIN